MDFKRKSFQLILIIIVISTVILIFIDKQLVTAHFKIFDKNYEIAEDIEGIWLREKMVYEHFYRWLKASNTETGFFVNSLDRRWLPEKSQKATLVSQARLIYVMGAGYDLTNDIRFLEATKNGSEFLIKRFKSDRFGRWHWSISPDGKVINTQHNEYGHAFVIFGLSHAFRVTGDKKYKDAAIETLRSLEILKTIKQYPGSPKSQKFSQNTLMHAFEALLTLHDITKDKYVLDDAFFIAKFVFDKLYQSKNKYLPELYDNKYIPLLEEDGGYIDIGHQFEWAYLLSWGVSKGLSDKYLEIGYNLIDFGINHGFDKKDGGIWAKSSYSGKVYGGKFWWQQCEFLRTAHRYAASHSRNDLIPFYNINLQYANTNFIDHEFGGWFAQAFDKNHSMNDKVLFKGNPWKVGYHVTGMFLELIK